MRRETTSVWKEKQANVNVDLKREADNTNTYLEGETNFEHSSESRDRVTKI